MAGATNPLDVGGSPQGFVSALTDVDTVARDQLGAIRYELNGVYKYVQFGASRTTNITAAMALGDVACYVLSAGSADIDRMTLADEANSAVGAGMVMATIAATGGPYYGWLQIRGVATLNQAVAGTPSVGNEITTSSASAKATTKRANAADITCGILVDNNTSTAPVVLLAFPN